MKTGMCPWGLLFTETALGGIYPALFVLKNFKGTLVFFSLTDIKVAFHLFRNFSFAASQENFR